MSASVIVVEPLARPTAGVKVPTHVLPPSADVIFDKAPEVASLRLRSVAGSKFATFSEKVNVTLAVSPTAKSVSSTEMVAVGAVVSSVYLMTFEGTLSLASLTSRATTEMK